jgi:hypothetical protein
MRAAAAAAQTTVVRAALVAVEMLALQERRSWAVAVAAVAFLLVVALAAQVGLGSQY